jgi:hypothetical protein
MGTNPITPTLQTETIRPMISADEAIRTLQRLRAEADASRATAAAGPMSLDADTFRRFVSTVRRHPRRVARLTTHPVPSMPRVPDAVMAHRTKTFS